MHLKHYIAAGMFFVLPMLVAGQGNGKNKVKDKAKVDKVDKVKDKEDKVEKTDKTHKVKDKEDHSNNVGKKDGSGHGDILWGGTKDHDGGGPKPSKNQPAKVRAAFKSDYPYVTNVQWSKYRGDWTATFPNGPYMSTAVYHANGSRRDTRTSLFRHQLPPNVIENVSKKYPNADVNSGVKIEIPRAFKDVYRIKTNVDGGSKYLFFNSDGDEVKYNY